MKPWEKGYTPITAPPSSSAGKPWDRGYTPRTRPQSSGPGYEEWRKLAQPGESYDDMIQRLTREREGAPVDPYEKAMEESDNKFLIGMGAGAHRIGMNVGNMLGLVSDEELAKEKEIYDKVNQNRDAAMGQFVGEMAATAPVGMGIGGAVAKGLSAAKPVAGRFLGTGAGAVAEGATEGALLAEQGERGTGAALGGATAGLLSLPLTAASKLINTRNPVGRITKEAEVFRDPQANQAALREMGFRNPSRVQPVDVTMAGSAENPMVRTLYDDFLTAAPGSSKKLRGEAETALTQWRANIDRQALPDWVDEADVKRLVDDVVDDPRAVSRNLNEFWKNDAYKMIDDPSVTPLRSDTFSRDFLADADKNVVDEVKDTLVRVQQPYAKSRQQAPLGVLKDAKSDLLKKASNPNLDTKTARDLRNAAKEMDNMIENSLRTSGMDDLANQVRQTDAAYGNYLERTTAAADAYRGRGAYGPEELARVGKRGSSDKVAAQGGGEFSGQRLGIESGEAVGALPQDPGLWRTAAVMGVTPSMKVGDSAIGKGVGTLASLVGIPQALASNPMQRYLRGEMGLQKGLSRIQNNPWLDRPLTDLGKLLRAGVVNQATSPYTYESD